MTNIPKKSTKLSSKEKNAIKKAISIWACLAGDCWKLERYLLKLLDVCNAQAETRVSIQSLANRCGVSQKTIMRHQKRLSSLGIITVSRTGWKATNLISFNIEHLFKSIGREPLFLKNKE